MRLTYFWVAVIISVFFVGNAPAQSNDAENSAEISFGEPRPKFASTMEAIEYFREKDGLTREELMNPNFNGGIGIVEGKTVASPTVLNHLSKDIPAKSLQSRLILMAYLKDRSLRVRLLASSALNHALQAYPGGMSLSDVSDVSSIGHRKMVKLFADKIAEQSDTKGPPVVGPDCNVK